MRIGSPEFFGLNKGPDMAVTGLLMNRGGMRAGSAPELMKFLEISQFGRPGLHLIQLTLSIKDFVHNSQGFVQLFVLFKIGGNQQAFIDCSHTMANDPGQGGGGLEHHSTIIAFKYV